MKIKNKKQFSYYQTCFPIFYSKKLEIIIENIYQIDPNTLYLYKCIILVNMCFKWKYREMIILGYHKFNELIEITFKYQGNYNEMERKKKN